MSSSIRSYRDLIAWQRAMDLAVECDSIIDHPRKRGRAILLNQLFRAAVSVPSNIAEGAGRDTTPDYLRHLSIANGSLNEVETHLILAERIGIQSSAWISMALGTASEVGRLLSGLVRSLR